LYQFAFQADVLVGLRYQELRSVCGQGLEPESLGTVRHARHNGLDAVPPGCQCADRLADEGTPGGARIASGMSSERPNMLGLTDDMASLASRGGLRTPPE